MNDLKRNSINHAVTIEDSRTILGMYNVQKAFLEKMNGLNPQEQQSKRMQLIRSNVDYAERILNHVQEQYGTIAEESIREVYVNHAKQREVAESMGYSLRTFQRRCREWLNSASEV